MIFKLPVAERLGRWKQFRNSISSLPVTEALEQTLNLWNSCPFIPFYLPPDTPNQWPDPWQLISENYYCDLAKTLGIVYTLYLSDHKLTLEPEIRVYYDPNTRYTYHIAYFNHGKYVINLVEDEIVNNTHVDQRLKLKYCYTAIDLKLEQY